MTTPRYKLKAFVSIPALANNIKGVTSPLGELSDVANSYAREKSEYTTPTKVNVKLISFTSRLDGTKDVMVVPARITDHVLTIAQWVFDKSITGDITSSPDAFSNLLLGEFSDNIVDLECGKMVHAKGNWMPSYITWKLDDGGDANELRIWFANDAFETQYDDYEIIVIAPIEPIDTFQKVRAEVVKVLSGFNLPDHDEKAHKLTDGIPETIRRTNDYLWHDREDADATLNTSWTVCIYGMAGNNPAIIKDAIADHILGNSAFDKEDWIPVFPDLFTSTEFTIVPMWYLLSIPDATEASSMYSPIVPYNEMLKIANKYIEAPKVGHIEKYLTVQTLHYMSLAFLTAGGVDNRDNKFGIKDYFPDYALIPPQSPDINRMSKHTYDWIIMLTKAVIAAEGMDEYSFIGIEFSRVLREGRTYVAFEFDKVLYLVLARMSMSEVKQ